MSNLGDLTINSTKKEKAAASREVGAQLEARRDLLKIENNKANEKLLSKTRDGVKGLPPGATIGNVRRFFRTSRSKTVPTQYPTINLPKQKDKLKLTPKEVRKRKSTGVIDGVFVYGPVKRWAQRLNQNPEKWGVDAQGNPRSLKGFVQWLNKSYADAQLRAKMESSRPGFGETHAGHATSVEEKGTNAPSNLAPQPARGIIRNMIGNLDIKGNSLHTLKELQDAGIDGGTLEGAFQEYMNEGQKNILSHKDLRISDQSKIAHGVDEEGNRLNAEGEAIQARRNLENRAGELQIKKANPQTTPIKANRLFQAVRHGARVAGSSPNPAANIGGDVVGVLMDGAAFLQDPKNPENVVDLALSGGQILTNLAAAGLTLIPGAGPGMGLIVMKAGDNLGKANNALANVEKMWNLARPGFNKAKKSINEIVQINKKEKPLSKADQLQIGPIQKETRQTPLNRLKFR
tara:strand:- start:41 stop:1423 length:1383 start_codon:yes stop_codon:yes gene_type:complete